MEPEKPNGIYEKQKSQYQQNLEAWQAAHPDWDADPISLMTEEDHRLALEKYGPLYAFHPSPYSSLTNMN